MAQRKATLERLSAFSDGVFSVVITIMVPELRPPERTILMGAYGWFTEGFGTRDLKDAKALLNE